MSRTRNMKRINLSQRLISPSSSSSSSSTSLSLSLSSLSSTSSSSSSLSSFGQGTKKRSRGNHYKTGKSSQQATSNFFCIICMDKKPKSEISRNPTCKHVFCSDCIAKHVQARIQENNSKIKCPYPKCQTLLDPALCRSILPPKVFNRWADALCEALVPDSQKFYCPFKDCSAMLINDGSGGVVTASECPYCRRLFCAQCKVKWHAGLSCSGFRKSKKGNSQREDMMVMELAKRKKWMRCPKCKFFVERKSGCLHISCRCGCQFCYRCGSLYTKTHQCA